MAKQARGTSAAVVGLVGNDGNVAGASVGSGDVADIVANTVANDGLIIIDPTDFGDNSGSNSGSGSDTSGEPVRKRRGRKPGSVSASKKGQALDINGVESILFSAHAMLAAITKTQELALDKSEANQLATAMANVSRHYDIAATQKSMDWANLLMCVGMVYGTRIYAIRAKRPPREKTPARNGVAGSVHIPGVGPGIFDPGMVQ